MKALNNIRYFTIFSLTILAISCSQNPFLKEDSQIRFVDLQGNARKIKLNTPSENVTALTKQGKISQAKLIEEENYKEEEEKPKDLSYNKYGQNGEQIQGKPEKLNDPKKNGLIYTMNMPTEKNDQETVQKPISDKKSERNKAQIEEKEYDLGAGKKSTSGGVTILSETKIPAENSSKKSTGGESTQLKRGTYIQAGSFTSMNHAKKHLNKVKALTNNPRNVNIQSAKVGNRNYYRVVIGPITQKKTANLIMKNLKSKGQDSIAIKIK